MELTADIKKGESFFGDGTFEKPKIKFYFTKPCPKLGIESSILPDFGKRPAFHCDGDQFSCDLCGLKFATGIDAVRHWQQEKMGQSCKLGKVDIPSIEVKPGIGPDTVVDGTETVNSDECNSEEDVKQFLDLDFSEKQDEELLEIKTIKDSKLQENRNIDDEYEEKDKDKPCFAAPAPLQRILKDLLGTLWLGRVSTPQVGLPS